LSGSYVVIGAGPAGVAAAKALVAGGHREMDRSSALPLGRSSRPSAQAPPLLNAVGYHFGATRLAVRVRHPAPARGCVYRRHCLDVCPYGHIYNAAYTIEEMRRSGEIE
jgi:predicted NAD/FAD-dependent oxidoreductase